MSDLFGQVLGKILGSQPSGGSRGGPAPDLGGLLAGVLGTDGSNLNAVVKRMLAAGLGSVVKSWVAKGPNHLISPDDLTRGLGADTIDGLAARFGVPTGQVAAMLAQYLPDAVDHMTPDGELPDGEVVDLSPKR